MSIEVTRTHRGIYGYIENNGRVMLIIKNGDHIPVCMIYLEDLLSRANQKLKL